MHCKDRPKAAKSGKIGISGHGACFLAPAFVGWRYQKSKLKT
jgi:hypothetical protein